MPVPTTNPSLQAIYSEFGAPVGTPITALVRGGTYVVDGIGTEDIPTAAPISVLDFAGAFVPAALSIASVQAVSGGSVSAVDIDGLSVRFTMQHATVSGTESVGATMTARVNIRVERATTARLFVSARPENAIVQGVYRSIVASVSYPPFDDAEQFINGTGPFVQDNVGQSQGRWELTGPCGPIGSSETLRVTDSASVTLSAVAGGVYPIEFTLQHELQARIAGPVGFGQTVTRNASGGSVVFPLALMFRDVGGALVQEVPINVTIDTAGSLQAVAINFA